MRNQATAHLNIDKFFEIFDDYDSENPEVDFLFSDKLGEAVFCFADDMVMSFYTKQISNSDLESGYEEIMDIVINVRYEIVECCYKLMDYLFTKYKIQMRNQHQFVPEGEFFVPGSLFIPLLMRK